jgi:YVTN family beta-propeller protein
MSFVFTSPVARETVEWRSLAPAFLTYVTFGAPLPIRGPEAVPAVRFRSEVFLLRIKFGGKCMRLTTVLAAAAAGGILLVGAGPSMAAGDVVDVGGTPLCVVVDADGTAYIGDYSAGGGVRVLPAGASESTRTLTTGFGPAGMALSADGTLFVEGWDFAQQQEKLAVIPKGSSGVTRTIALTPGAHLIAAAPDGTVFVPNPNLGTVSVIPPGADAPAREIFVGANPREVAVAKDGTAYVTNQNDGTVSVIPAGASSVSHTIQVSSMPGRTSDPHGIAVGPDGTVYVTNITANDVAVIKPGDAAVAYRVAVPGGPKEVAVGSDGTVYVLYMANGLSVIRPGGTSVSLGLPTGQDPGHLALAPDGSVLVTNTTAKSVTVFASQVLHAPQPPQSNVQGTQPQVEEPGPPAQAPSDNAGDGFWASIPVVLGAVAAAMLIGAATLVLTGRRRRGSKAAEEAAAIETAAEELEGIHVLSDQRQS